MKKTAPSLLFDSANVPGVKFTMDTAHSGRIDFTPNCIGAMDICLYIQYETINGDKMLRLNDDGELHALVESLGLVKHYHQPARVILERIGAVIPNWTEGITYRSNYLGFNLYANSQESVVNIPRLYTTFITLILAVAAGLIVIPDAKPKEFDPGYIDGIGFIYSPIC